MVVSITGMCVCIHAFTHTYTFISSSTQTHTHAHVCLHIVTYAANASSASTGVQNLGWIATYHLILASTSLEDDKAIQKWLSWHC